MELQMRVKIKMRFVRNGIKNDNRNAKQPTTFYLTELDIVVFRRPSMFLAAKTQLNKS